MPLRKPRPETVMGHVLPEPRLTPLGLVLLVAAVSLPVVAVGSLLDLGVQAAFGTCVGLWCAF